MASKLSVFAALFVCFLVLADASFRVTTTVLEEEENPLQRQQCQQQLQRQRLQTCQRFLSSQLQRGSGRWDDDILDDEDITEETNPQQQSLQQCCQEIQQVNRECRCQALQEIERMTQQQHQSGRYSGSRFGGQQQKIKQQVRQIPQMCRVQVPQQCQQGY